MKEDLTVFWFRRDLRIDDNHGLFKALSEKNKVLPIFILDTNILGKLEKEDKRLTIIFTALDRINDAMKRNRCNVGMYLGKPKAVFLSLINKYNITKVITNKDYEPYAIERDNNIKNFLNSKGIIFESYKDQVIFEENEVVKDNGDPYRVYTPYSNKWLQKFKLTSQKSFPSQEKIFNFYKTSQPLLNEKEIGFKKYDLDFTFDVSENTINRYNSTRNFPSLNSTSKVGLHLRFGTVSIRSLVYYSAKFKDITFLKELIWREFFMQILWHYPSTVNKSFKEDYDNIDWINNKTEFERWCNGETGYPLIDAGMKQLNKTGFMHNRCRMATGSFLCKHLLIDWRWGEKYFAKKLLDYEQSSNVGNWQWVSGCGVDAAPYFRIFNPTEQQKKFDKNFNYIKKWVNNYDSNKYPSQIIDHKFARERCLNTYKYALGK
tara:strand:- start:9200 stop:10498 length:1299 start_codon:yes stop_codon:yes gene_type:complete